jgi:hypothetical protein
MDLVRCFVEGSGERHEPDALSECDIFGNKQNAAAGARGIACDRRHALSCRAQPRDSKARARHCPIATGGAANGNRHEWRPAASSNKFAMTSTKLA